MRAMVKYLDNVSDEEIVDLNIPTGIPLVYELDADLKPIRHKYLGDPMRSRRRWPPWQAREGQEGHPPVVTTRAAR